MNLNRTRVIRTMGCILLALALLASGCTATPAAVKQDKFSFGIIADVQWGDKDKEGGRNYREALGRLEESVVALNGSELAFTIQLGDLIDGHADNLEKTRADLERALDMYQRLDMPGFHVVGNHCIVAGREFLRQKLDLTQFYYDFTLPSTRGWRFIVLDGNDGGEGVLGAEQLAWLSLTLQRAKDSGEKVIVFNHYALLEEAARQHRMKAPEPILAEIEAAGVVVAYFAGHDHAGGYTFRNGIHHVTLRGMIEAKNNAYAVVEVYANRLKKIGYGKEPSREMYFTP